MELDSKKHMINMLASTFLLVALELRITHTQMMFMCPSTRNSFFLLVAAKGDGT